ncbi:hypothetical protein NX059_008155 [Plenodomus lindquistii]|nr:hypothetical protein NX059_008155 [Plenodomus lindquistii]
MATYNPFAHIPKPDRRTSRAHSLLSETAFSTASYATPAASPTPTPKPTSAPAPRSRTAAAAGHPSIPAPEPKQPIFILPDYWNLPPTYPSPFTGTLEASLDAIQDWSRRWGGMHGVQCIVDTLLKSVDTSTRWNEVLIDVLLCRSHVSSPPLAACPRAVMDNEGTQRGRELLEDLLFLVARTLLPEQIVENRDAMARLYERRKQLGIKLVLRYDMLFAWRMSWNGKDHRSHAVVVNCSLPPANTVAQHASVDGGTDVKMADVGSVAGRRPLMPNVWPTLLLPPPEWPRGFATHAVRERMRHHVTDLDDVLVYTDEQVQGWTNTILVARTASALLMWQWIRGNNEMLGEMDMDDWQDLDGKADECDWIAD